MGKQSDTYNKNFDAALAMLNDEQKKAVEQTEGSVLVVAGPGTGKTQLLAARIGYILKHTDASAYNILALTFTNAGAIAMRERLLRFIGPEAYNVTIFTFHSFCTSVIQDNLDYFGGYYDLQAASNLEKLEISRRIIDEFRNDDVLKRFKGDIYSDQKKLLNFFNLTKEENWDLKEKKALIHGIINGINEPGNPEYTYSRNSKTYKKGEPKKDKIKKDEKPWKRTLSAMEAFPKYNKYLIEKGRFDYNDMILWVIKAFRENPELLLEYQERFQYILVDEYQDTNGSQNALLDLLVSYWEDPNLFVVGDDDQSIFKFQGAVIDNIQKFYEHYQPRVIILGKNYRSSQAILDKATELIECNDTRLVNRLDYVEKDLIESRMDRSIQIEPMVLAFENDAQEECYIAQQIEHLYKDGEDLSKIAVIYRNNNDINDIAKFLEYKGVPFNMSRKLNILTTDEIRRFVSIFTYISQELSGLDNGNSLLFEILHYEYFGLKSRDIARVAIHCSRRTDEVEDDRSWDAVLTSIETLEGIGVEDAEQLKSTYEKIKSWIGFSMNATLQVLFELILTEGKVIETIMQSSDKTWRLQIVNTFFDFIKNESVKKPDYSISNLLDHIAMLHKNEEGIQYNKIISNKNGVNLLTAHSAKGLEFDQVYIIKCISKNWGNQKSNNRGFKIPESMVPQHKKSNIEDERRLFFVGMTRARNELYMSYAKKSKDDKDQEPSIFLSECVPFDSFNEMEMPDNEIVQFTADIMRYVTSSFSIIDEHLIDRVLQSYKMSVTNLNKYLKCPYQFYFENILRVPQARTAPMGFGKAMHYALEKFISQMYNDPEKHTPPVEDLIKFFQKGMDYTRSHFTEMEYANALTLGQNALTAYYHEYKDQWKKPHHYKTEYYIENAEYQGVPIKGIIDRIDIFQHHIEVIDYKTGTYKSEKIRPYSEGKHAGGDYWRQMVFYKMLIDSDTRLGKTMKEGIIDFLIPDNEKFTRKSLQVSSEDVEVVGNQLVDTYSKIKNKVFDKGCDEEHCRWCNFVKSNYRLESSLESFEDFEEER